MRYSNRLSGIQQVVSLFGAAPGDTGRLDLATATNAILGRRICRANYSSF
jgi:hypothetical protein